MDLDKVNPYIFRTHGIRGIAGEDLNEDIVFRAGLAFGHCIGHVPVVSACDHRLSSPALKEALMTGLCRAGCNVMDAGTAPKGLAMFAAGRLDRPLAYISASHLPAEWNGLKFDRPNGMPYGEKETQALKQAFWGNLDESANPGKIERRNWLESYLDHLTGILKPAECRLKALVDSGNGTGAILAPELLRRLGFEITELFGDLDGHMPNRTSEPSPESLTKAGEAMPGHDLGMAFDGDADRVAFIDKAGRMIDPERFAFVILRKLLETEPGPIVVNMACGSAIADIAKRFDRELIRTPVGTVNLLGAIKNRNAAFGLETSSHIFIPSLVPYDDGCVVGAYAAWALSCAMAAGTSLSDLLAAIPPRERRSANFKIPDKAKIPAMKQLGARFRGEDGKLETTDGYRLTLNEGWALVRASNTENVIKLVIEADTSDECDRLEEHFTHMVEEVIANARL